MPESLSFMSLNLKKAKAKHEGLKKRELLKEVISYSLTYAKKGIGTN